MSLRDLTLKNEYRSLKDNIPYDFYIPTLSEARVYKRSVGFFSSSILAVITKGLCKFVQNGGTIKLVASPHLSDEDIEAIRQGYKNRDSIIKDALLRELKDPINESESERLNLLSNLVAAGILDVKIAFTELGMYHEKLGIIEDSDGNAVVFTGSPNESKNAVEHNYETMDVYCSWKDYENRVPEKIQAFEAIWNGTETNLTTVDFPELKDEIIKKYKKHEPNYELDENERYKLSYHRNINSGDLEFHSPEQMYYKDTPKLPEMTFFDYQDEAMNNWIANNSRGIFDMATGTGKTLTGLGALTLLSEKLNHKLATIIVCPYQHLVEQWVEDINKFSIKPIIGYSSSKQKDWKKRLEKAVEDQQIRKDKPFFCFICTNATFKSSFVQNQIDKIKCDTLLLVDEAHNFGAPNLIRLLDNRFKYRLALSATLERQGDEEGTEALFDFFGSKCISYGMERAIKEKKLTPYYYYPIIVYLSPDELEEYEELSKQLVPPHAYFDQKGKYHLDDYAKTILIMRSRIVAGAIGKLDALKKAIEPYKHEKNILVYCGATTIINENADSSETDDKDIRQITAVTKLLGNEFDMDVHKFTSEENMEEREIIKKRFVAGDLQAVVAIKCLDEGVNIPGIKTAFILASTTNPKEYIQRRGRVLRKANDKDYAEIFDFVTLPRDLDTVSGYTKNQISSDLSLVSNEIKRIYEFSRLAKNPMDGEELINQILETYEIDREKILKEENENGEF